MRKYGTEFLRQYGYKITFQQRQVMSALSRCQTGELGRAIYSCKSCYSDHISNCSCGNRHCPNCQGGKTLDWIKKQEEKSLPIEYFLMTFTIPEELRNLVYKYQKSIYPIMFKKSSEVVFEMMDNPKNLGVKFVGFTSIIHTWGGQLQYHPHIHILLPGGGLDSFGKWKGFPPGFGLKVKAASKLWMGKLLSAIENIVGRKNLPKKITKKKFVVHCKSVGSGQGAIRYLSRYVFRVGIHNSRILKVENDNVTFQYKDKMKSNRKRSLTLNVHEFIKRFLFHVLPSGFMKVRHYGFHHSNSKIDKITLKLRIMKFSEQLLKLIQPPPKCELGKVPAKCNPICRFCGNDLELVIVIRKEFQPLKDTG